MNTPQRIRFASSAIVAGLRHSAFAPLPPAAARAPVLPSRCASRQLELPFLALPAAPRHRLRTG